MIKPIDVVYTWVDDRQSGYLDMLKQHARAGIDLNPNRTRDNLNLLKYSLRSLESYVDWHGEVYILTCRPQKPAWLDQQTQHISVIHHDEIIDSCYLPTFNSFCIISHLAFLKDISDPFLYMEDDMLFASPTEVDDFISEDRQIILRPRFDKTTDAARRHDQEQPPWNKALSYSNHLLDSRYGQKERRSINHVPVMIYKQPWIQMTEIWRDAFEHTRQSKFREQYNVAPEYLYQYFMLYTERAKMGTFRNTYGNTLYLGLDNNILLTAAGLKMIRLLKPKMFCLNDNFGDRPNAYVVSMVKKFLEDNYPDKSSFEC